MFAFEKSTHLSRNTSGALDDFFNEQDIVTSVVREALQNILDAPATEGQPVRARFSFRELAWEDFEPYTRTSDSHLLDDHLNSETLERHRQSFRNQQIRTLLIEDYNTTGLVGDFDKEQPNSTSNLVNFWWNSGKGNKGKGGSNGSAGVGKICFIAASKMRTMWAVSKRLNDSNIPKILIGTTNLPHHHVGGVSYIGDAQYGVEYENPETGVLAYDPITDIKVIERFETSFDVDRREPGLSVIVPAVTDEITIASLKAAVLKQYFWAIINQNLVVEFSEEDGTTTILEPNTISDHLADQSRPEKSLAQKVDLASQAQQLLVGASPVIFNGLDIAINESGKYTFTKDQLSEENLEALLQSYDQGEMVRLQLSVPFQDLQTNVSKNGHLDLFFKKFETNADVPKEFIRRSVSLTHMENAIARSIPKNVYCFLLIHDKDLSDFVVSAEDPAHIKLTKQKFRKERLFAPEHALSFIMEAEKLVYDVLNRTDEEKDVIENFDEDVFSIKMPDNTEQTKPTNKKGKHKKETKPPKIKVRERSEPLITQTELRDSSGFEIRSLPAIGNFIFDGEISLPLTLTVKAAYQTLNGPTEAWKLYSPVDFQMGKDIAVSCEPPDAIQVVNAANNILKLEISKADFKVTLSGFDKNRDLVTKANVTS